jgi:PadR family transcriptional regulator PadR
MNLNNWQTQLRKGLLELVVLNMLKGEPCHGYEMVQKLKKLQGLKIREGNIYPILARLQTDGLIKSTEKSSPEGPPRKYFELTQSGKEYLEKMNSHWETVQQNIEQIRKGKV